MYNTNAYRWSTATVLDSTTLIKKQRCKLYSFNYFSTNLDLFYQLSFVEIYIFLKGLQYLFIGGNWLMLSQAPHFFCLEPQWFLSIFWNVHYWGLPIFLKEINGLPPVPPPSGYWLVSWDQIELIWQWQVLLNSYYFTSNLSPHQGIFVNASKTLCTISLRILYYL